jgi:hypothetical protein
MYILNQKINSLEEKTSVLDNFSQSIFQFITQREEAKLKDQEKDQVKEVVYSNQAPSTPLAPKNDSDADAEVESESDENQYDVTDEKSGEQLSENFESKEILSEMVSELKESLIKNNMENLENDLQQIQELKEELKEEFKEDLKEEKQNLDLDLDLTNSETVADKKKEEDLNKMSLADIKLLAKNKNIPLVKQNKPKKKELLIQEILA